MRIRFLLKMSGLCLLILACVQFSYAQVKRITGRVTEKKTGQTLPGVTVSVKGKSSSVAASADGSYAIQADAKDVLIFSFIGYKRQEIPVNNRTAISVVMVEDQSDLDEVVVVGYGTKRKSELTGAVATIKASEIEDVPAPDMAGALRNRIAGLGVSAQSGAPGATISLNVRGAKISANASNFAATGLAPTNQPLYVIDGITSTQEQFEMLDPSMVDDITVLKDASAAIYGASGSKGVILVSTKRGGIGKPKFTYNGYMGINDASKKSKMLSGYEQAKAINDGYDQTGTLPSGAGYFTQSELQYLKDHPQKSWFDEIWQPSVLQRHNVSMSGGNNAVTFFAGGSYQNQNANYRGDYYQRKYSFRSGISAKFSDALKADVGFNVNYNKNYSNIKINPTDQNYTTVLMQVPQWVPLTIDGVPVNFTVPGYNFKNPLAAAQSGYYDNDVSASYTLNAAISYTPKTVPGLALRFQIGQTGTWGGSNVYNAPYKVYDFYRTGLNQVMYTDSLLSVTDGVAAKDASINPTIARGSSYQGNVTVNYARSFGKHSVAMMVGGEQSGANNESTEIFMSNQQVANITDSWAYDASTLILRNRNLNESIKQSFFGRLSYDFQKKYILEGVGRFDASSNFAKGHVWGFFLTLVRRGSFPKKLF